MKGMGTLATAVVSLSGFSLLFSAPDVAAQTAPEASYIKIDNNTYLINGYDKGLKKEVFVENLAQFRREVSGDFQLILGDSRYPFNDDALAIRTKVTTKDGKVNRIVEVVAPISP